MCLETVARFMDYQYKCSFDLRFAQDILQDGRLFTMILIIDVQYLDFSVMMRERLYSF